MWGDQPTIGPTFHPKEFKTFLFIWPSLACWVSFWWQCSTGLDTFLSFHLCSALEKVEKQKWSPPPIPTEASQRDFDQISPWMRNDLVDQAAIKWGRCQFWEIQSERWVGDYYHLSGTVRERRGRLHHVVIQIQNPTKIQTRSAFLSGLVLLCT